MGIFDKLLELAENAKADAVNKSKKSETPYPNSIKERGYQAYKNGSDETRANYDKNAVFNEYKGRYEREKKK